MPEVVLTSTRMLWYIGTHISIHQQAPKVTLKTNNPHRFSILVMDTQWVNDRVGVLHLATPIPKDLGEDGSPWSFKNSRILPF